nr:hypothetical protein [Tanacetum cinerariifolium]
ETPPSGSPLLLPIPLPVSSPTLLLPSTSHREDEGLQEALERIMVFLALWMMRLVTDVAGLSQRMTDFVTTVKQDIDEIYVRLDNAYPKEDATDYPTDRDDDDEDKEEESFKDKAYDEKDDEDEEEEEHPALADSVPPRVHRVVARMFVRDHTPISHPLETEVARLLVIPTPPPSLLSPFSSPLPPKYHHYQLRAKSPSTSHLPPPIVLPDTKASIPMLRVAAPSTYILAPRSETPPSGSPLLLP